MTAAAVAELPGEATIGEVLRNPNFSIYFVAAFISNAGTFMQSVGVPFVMYDLTKRNAWVGASVFAGMVPSMLMLLAITDQLTPWRIIGLLIVAGFAVGFQNAVAHALIPLFVQLQVDESYRGRVLELFIMFSFLGVPLGSLIGGRLGDAIGLQPTLASFGLLLLVYAAVLVVRFDSLSCLDARGAAT